jgi:5-deoxy-glucuronate isomerase
MKILNPAFRQGYTPLTDIDDPFERNTLMKFGVLKLGAEESYNISARYEKALLLLTGTVKFSWGTSGEFPEEANASRASLFDQNPACLHVPEGFNVSITSEATEAELVIIQTQNGRSFRAKFYSPDECRSEHRGAGTMRETSTRVVRTIFDQSNRPEANLVLGEVIDYPGKWSSYPPHHHPQPEIYHYRFLPDNGFGFAMLGDNVVKVQQGDTVLILNDASHPQVSAPGYAMFYVWVIRNLDGKPYGSPTFEPEHTWVQKKNARIWPYDT